MLSDILSFTVLGPAAPQTSPQSSSPTVAFIMVSYPTSYVFPFPLTDDWKQEIMRKTREKLTEMLGVEVDNVMAVRVL